MNAALMVLLLCSLQSQLVPGIPRTSLSLSERWDRLEATPRIVGSSGTATAVVIGRKDDELYLLTSEHVVRNNFDLRLEFFDRASHPKVARTINFGTTLEVFPVPDFAVVKFPLTKGQSFRVVQFATKESRTKRFPSVGVSIGCTNGKPPTCEDTVITAKRLTRRLTNDDIAFFWETEQIPIPGRSGGPLFGPDGRLMGVCAATTTGKGFYTHWDEILLGLKQRKLDWLLKPVDGSEKTELRKNR